MKVISANKEFGGLVVKVFSLAGKAYDPTAVIDLDTLPLDEKANVWQRYLDGDFIEYTEPKGNSTKKEKE